MIHRPHEHVAPDHEKEPKRALHLGHVSRPSCADGVHGGGSVRKTLRHVCGGAMEEDGCCNQVALAALTCEVQASGEERGCNKSAATNSCELHLRQV